MGHLIDNDQSHKSLEIAKKFTSVSHFGHSLELLLHQTLEREDQTQNFSQTLQKVVDFLRNFHQFPGGVIFFLFFFFFSSFFDV
jgi:hypothetical protein